MVSDLKKVIDQVSREKGVDQAVLIGALEEAVKAAARKKYGTEYDLEVIYNDEMGEVEAFEFKEVVEKVENEHLQISLGEALELDSETEIGDSLGIKMDPDTFGRIAAQSAKQVIMQRLKEAERDIVYDDFIDRRGEIVNGIVQRFDRGSIIVNLGRAEAELPHKEQIPRESYKQGDRVRAYILDVRKIIADLRLFSQEPIPISSQFCLKMRCLRFPKGLYRSCRWPVNPGAGQKSPSVQKMLMWILWAHALV